MEKKMHAGALKPLFQWARELRNNCTVAESILWGYLKTKPYGLKFRRQHPYFNYILDFYCHALKLVIEVDGSVHDKEEVKFYDKERQALLENDGLTVIRFTNDMVEKDFEMVKSTIDGFILKNRDEK